VDVMGSTPEWLGHLYSRLLRFMVKVTLAESLSDTLSEDVGHASSSNRTLAFALQQRELTTTKISHYLFQQFLNYQHQPFRAVHQRHSCHSSKPTSYIKLLLRDKFFKAAVHFPSTIVMTVKSCHFLVAFRREAGRTLTGVHQEVTAMKE
jgi:hypothetical protein